MSKVEKYKLFSKRTKSGTNKIDVYQYDDLPGEFRNQVYFIWKDTIGFVSRSLAHYSFDSYGSSEQISLAYFEQIEEFLKREYGRLRLAEGNTPSERVFSFFLSSTAGQALDIIELSFRLLPAHHAKRKGSYLSDLRLTPSQAIEELNQRFRERGIGYRFENELLIRIDSEYLHAEAVQPALQLLRDLRFKGALAEFANAHEHFRHKRYAESLTDCLKALESTLKTICEQRKWSYPKTAQAKDLLKTVFEHNLIPDYLQCHYGSLRASLESGVPTVRNKDGAHGSGEEIRVVPDYLASYLLNLTATSILFFIRANDAYRKKK